LEHRSRGSDSSYMGFGIEGFALSFSFAITPVGNGER
jgi:hypothetical protein